MPGARSVAQDVLRGDWLNLRRRPLGWLAPDPNPSAARLSEEAIRSDALRSGSSASCAYRAVV